MPKFRKVFVWPLLIIFLSPQTLFSQTSPILTDPTVISEQPLEQPPAPVVVAPENPVPNTSTAFLAQEISPLSLPSDPSPQVQSVPRSYQTGITHDNYYDPEYDIIGVYGDHYTKLFETSLPYLTVDHVDAYEDYLIIDRSINNSDGGARVEIFYNYIQSFGAPSVILPDIAVTELRRLTNGDLVVRSTAANQMGDYTTTISQGQVVSRVYSAFEIIEVSGGYPSPLTLVPLQNCGLGCLATITAQPMGISPDLMVSNFSSNANTVTFDAPLSDQGVGIYLGNDKITPASIPTIKLAASGSSDLLRIELVSIENVDTYLQREIKDSVLLHVLPGMQNFDIPLSAFTGIDFIKQQTYILFAINPVAKKSTYTLQIGRAPVLWINGFSEQTSQQQVTLAVDPPVNNGGQIVSMSYAINSWDESAFSAWEPYVSERQIQLPAFQGRNYVNVRLRDEFGNVTYVWNSILYDSIAPSGSVTINDGAPYTNSRDTTLNLAVADAVSGLFGYNGSYSMSYAINTVNPYAFTWTWYDPGDVIRLPDYDGVNYVNVKISDRAGNESFFWDSIVLDRQAPVGSIVINQGDAYTRSRNVTVDLSLADSLSGVSEISYAIDSQMESDFSAWEPYVASKALTLLDFEASHTVFIRAKDGAGNIRTFQDTIVYDATPPSLAFTLNGGAAAVTTREVTLSLNAVDGVSGVSQMSFAFNSLDESAFSAWEPFSNQKTVQLPNYVGDNYVNVRVRDAAGNIQFAWAKVVYEPAMMINGGDGFTRSQDIWMVLPASFNGAQYTQMCYAFNSLDAGAFSAWESFSSSRPLQLPPYQGKNYVNIKVRDAAGNERLYWSSIVLDQVAPGAYLAINDGDESTDTRDVTLSFNFLDSVSGVSDFSYAFNSLDESAFSPWEPYTAGSSKRVTLPPYEGTNYVNVRVRDRAGNVKLVWDSIVFDPNHPPLPSGWKRAGTNPNYAFKEISYPGYRFELTLRNLMTGEDVVLGGVYYWMERPDRPFNLDHLDVSPDGKYAVYEIERQIHIKNLKGSGGASLPQDYIFTYTGAVDFQADALMIAVAPDYGNGANIVRNYEFRYSDQQLRLKTARLANLGRNLAFSPDGKLVASYERFYDIYGYSFDVFFRVSVYERLDSEGALTTLREFVVKLQAPQYTTEFGAGHFDLADIYQTPSGRYVVTIGMDTLDSQMDAGELSTMAQTVLLDPYSGQQLQLNGAAVSVTRYSQHGFYRMLARSCSDPQKPWTCSTTVKTAVVDLENLQLVGEY